MSVNKLLILSIFSLVLSSNVYAQSESISINTSHDLSQIELNVQQSNVVKNVDDSIADFQETNYAVNLEKVARVLNSKKDKSSRSIDADMLKKMKLSRSEIATIGYDSGF